MRLLLPVKQLLQLSLVLLTAAALVTSGCATSPKRQAWLDGIRARDVEEAVYQKIRRWRKTELTEIEHLAKKGVPPADTLRHLQESKAVYHLTTKDIDRLRAAGVEEEVIDYLLSTPRLGNQRLRQPNPFRDPFCPPHLRYGYGYRGYWP